MGCLQVKPCKNPLKDGSTPFRGRGVGKKGQYYRKKWVGAGGPHPPSHGYCPDERNDSYYMKKWAKADGTRLTRPRPAGFPLTWGMDTTSQVPTNPPVRPKTSANAPLDATSSPTSSTVPTSIVDASVLGDTAKSFEVGERGVSSLDTSLKTSAKREAARLVLRRLYDLNTAFIMAIDQHMKSQQQPEEEEEEGKEKEEGEEEEAVSHEEEEGDVSVKRGKIPLSKSRGRRARGRRNRKRGKKGVRTTNGSTSIATTTDDQIESWLTDIMTDVAEEIEADLLVAYMLADLDACRQRDENKESSEP